MPANARKDIVREGEIGTYHCWSRGASSGPFSVAMIR